MTEEPYCAWCTDGLDQPPYCGNEGCKPMPDTATETFPGIDQIEAIYIIHSADTTRDGEGSLDHMASRVEPFLRTEDGEYGLVQTEGDDQYDFDYLADEMGKTTCTWCDGSGASSPWESRPGYWRYSVELGGIGPITACEHCGGTGEEESAYRNGHHRKWAGLLPGDRYEEFCDAFMIDLDDTGLPERGDDTMGSLTEYGHLPAISIDDSEGWNSGYSDGGVIDSNIYLSIMLKEN